MSGAPAISDVYRDQEDACLPACLAPRAVCRVAAAVGLSAPSVVAFSLPVAIAAGFSPVQAEQAWPADATRSAGATGLRSVPFATEQDARLRSAGLPACAAFPASLTGAL